MRIVFVPLADPGREIDVTDRLVAAIAEELWQLYGGNDRLNWLEAERHLERLVGHARETAKETTFVRVSPPRVPVGPSSTGRERRVRKPRNADRGTARGHRSVSPTGPRPRGKRSAAGAV